VRSRPRRGELEVVTQRIEQLKARLGARVENAFHIIKNRFGHRKLHYRGLKKNAAQLKMLFALANLVIAKGALLA
jgi:IS5 family transposase